MGLLRKRLAELGVTRQAVGCYGRILEGMHPVLRPPIRHYHLRREGTPLADALRALFFADPIAPQAARVVFGSLLGELRDHGLLVEREGATVCPFLANFVDDLIIFTDDLSQGSEAVMGAGSTTASLLQAAYPLSPVQSLLDVGTGAGTGALLLARQAGQSLGTDLNPRAIALAEFNARFNAIPNASFAVGDLFSPVAGRRFDRIVSQPPFVAFDESTEHATWLHGGRRGDELALRLIAELPQYLSERGRAILLVEWPIGSDGPVPDRIRRALGDAAVDILLLLCPKKDIDDHVTYYAAGLLPQLGPEFERRVHVGREHFFRAGIEALQTSLVVLKPAAARVPFTSTLEVPRFGESEPTSLALERLLGARDLLALPEADFLAAHLVIPPGARFSERDDGRIQAILPENRLVQPLACSRASIRLLDIVADCPTVGEALGKAPGILGATTPRERILTGIREALELGLLEILVE